MYEGLFIEMFADAPAPDQVYRKTGERYQVQDGKVVREDIFEGLETVIPDIAMDNPEFFMTPASEESLKTVNMVQRDEFVKEMLGDCLLADDPIHELQRVANADKELDALLKSAGKPGEKLLRLKKSSGSLGEAMEKMVENFKEFFTVEDQHILERAIKTLDLHAFFEIINERVYEGAA